MAVWFLVDGRGGSVEGFEPFAADAAAFFGPDVEGGDAVGVDVDARGGLVDLDGGFDRLTRRGDGKPAAAQVGGGRGDGVGGGAVGMVAGVLPGRVLRLAEGCLARTVYGGMWHFRRAGKQAGLTVCGIVISMSGPGYAVWEEADLAVSMWGRICAGCRGAVVALEETGSRGEGETPSDTGYQMGLFG